MKKFQLLVNKEDNQILKAKDKNRKIERIINRKTNVYYI